MNRAFLQEPQTHKSCRDLLLISFGVYMLFFFFTTIKAGHEYLIQNKATGKTREAHIRTANKLS